MIAELIKQDLDDLGINAFLYILKSQRDRRYIRIKFIGNFDRRYLILKFKSKEDMHLYKIAGRYPNMKMQCEN